MVKRIRVFLDTSVLFASIWSDEGAARLILKLGETGIIKLIVSSQVISELEGALHRKAPDLLGLMTYFLDRSGVEVVRKASNKHIAFLKEMTGHPADAQVVSAAWDADVSYFVTLNRKHFLSRAALVKKVPFPMGTPGEFLTWYRKTVVRRV